MPNDEVVITPYRDGPLLVRGPVRFRDQDGNEIVVERSTVALCRCGKSRMRPLCDGTHKVIGFRASSGFEDERAMYAAAGGMLPWSPSQPAGASAATGASSSDPRPASQASST